MRSPKILAAILVGAPVTFLLTAHASLSEPAAEECKSKPGLSTPRGSHWYYRINRANKQHCWYLGGADARVAAHVATPLASTRAPAKTSATKTAGATPRQTPEETASSATAAVPVALDHAALWQPPLRGERNLADFAARWPDLPAAQDLEQSELSGMSNSYAERNAPADATAQLPSRWPVVDTTHAGGAAPRQIVPPRVSLASAVAVALLLVAECVFKLAGRDRRHLPASGWRLRLQADLAQHPAGRSTTVEDHGDLTRRVATPTDPADDLKTSLAELMRDLRRAGAASDPMRSSTPAANRTVDELELA
jgi:hypothetical protein